MRLAASPVVVSPGTPVAAYGWPVTRSPRSSVHATNPGETHGWRFAGGVASPASRSGAGAITASWYAIDSELQWSVDGYVLVFGA